MIIPGIVSSACRFVPVEDIVSCVTLKSANEREISANNDLSANSGNAAS